MATILFLSAESMSNAFGAIGRSFAPGFASFGHRLVEIDFTTPGGSQRLNAELQQGDILFALSFLGFGSDMSGIADGGGSVNFWQASGIPFISLFGDTPAYFFDRHVMPAQTCACLYAFPDHLEFRKTLPGVRGMLAAIPPGPMDVVSRTTIDFAKKRSGRLLFLKNGNDPAALMSRWRDALPEGVCSMLLELASYLEGRLEEVDAADIDRAVSEMFSTRGWDATTLPAMRLLFVAQLDDYLRRLKSTMMAKVLMDFPVDMYGENWDHLDFRGKRINFTPHGDYERSGPLIRDALGVIDMSPNTSGAAHERASRAFGTYTLCLTNRQRFMLDHVAHAEEFSYVFSEEGFREKVAEVIANPARFVEIGAAAAEDFRNKFPWVRFPEFLIDTAEMLRIGRFGTRSPIQPYLGWPPKSFL